MAMADIKSGLDAAGGDVQSYFASSPPEAEAHLQFRYILARNLTKTGTLAGVQEGLRNHLEVANLSMSNRSMKKTANDFIPGLYLRLGRDKEFLEFMTAKCNGDLDEIYRWHDQSTPPPQADAEVLSLAQAAMLCVFKLRILMDLRDLHQAGIALGDKVPAELFHECRSYLVGEATKTNAEFMRAIEKREDLKPDINVIEADLCDLETYINALDVDYFDAIANPEKYRKMQPAYEEELLITEALAQTYDAWAETPGAFAMFQWVCDGHSYATGDDDVD